MVKKVVCVTLDERLVEEIDRLRGAIKRSTYIETLLTDVLRRSGVLSP